MGDVIDSTQVAEQAMQESQTEAANPTVDNSKLQAFKYRNAKGEIANRNVYIIHEDALSIVGFDFNKLSESEKRVVHKVFDSHDITPPPAPGTTSLNYATLGINKSIFNKAYRNFLKQNIQ